MNKFNDTERAMMEGQVMDSQAMEHPEPRQVAWQYAFARLGSLALAGYLHMHGDHLAAVVLATCLSISFAVASFRQSA